MELLPTHERLVEDAQSRRHELANYEQQVAETIAAAQGHKVGDVWVSKRGWRARATTIRYSLMRPYYSVYGYILRSNGTETDKKVHLTDLFAGWRKE